MDFKIKSCSELQQYLRDRGVIISGFKKQELVDLCRSAESLGIELDPDGILECKTDTVKAKLTVRVNDASINLPIPTQLEMSNDFSQVPVVRSFDILSYLAQSRDYSYGSLRDPTKLEGYSMCKDGYVIDLKAGRFAESEEHHHLQFQVKPRTNAKDPSSGLPYYIGWILLTAQEDSNPIISAYCCCRGGIDGYCRHVAAALFEYMPFVDDRGPSCTSKPCTWYFRGSSASTQQAVEVTELNLSTDPRSKTQFQVQSTQVSVVPWPDPDELLSTLKRVHPEAVALDAVFGRPKKAHLPLSVLYPDEKLKTFITRQCTCVGDCQCSFQFVKNTLTYEGHEIETIEKETRGQAENENWHRVRKTLLTASNFKKVCQSTDGGNTADSLLKGSSLKEDRLPAAIRYGRLNENRARKLFVNGHRLNNKSCKKCHVQTTGIFLYPDHPFLACSPDGIMNCQGDQFLIEIKCLYKHRNFSPLVAAKMSGIVKVTDDGKVILKENHPYNFQIQGQMGITNVRMSFLIIYTDKGVYPVMVPFNEEFWKACQQQLVHFYHTFFYPRLCKSLTDAQ